jgi:hypothetical protein
MNQDSKSACNLTIASAVAISSPLFLMISNQSNNAPLINVANAINFLIGFLSVMIASITCLKICQFQFRKLHAQTWLIGAVSGSVCGATSFLVLSELIKQLRL